ncbi:hypothetical protein F4820DRAFT_398592 [Hypoxylon rubiginosum]|uniref:Uncharacterized protein n=1 Tax=Hypoxylon rubiginosum TaxID=110542 RepID=A0ACB9YTV7_9PEZI|nr:hypothetical protein F4820DRAFT_398592 [Hypoxylon rubiginosum]
MLSSIAISFLLGLASLTHAAPTLGARASISDIAGAQNAWASDTSHVSQFLSAAPTLSGASLTSQAQAALDAELDELTRKAVLDKQFAADPSVQAAGATLARPDTFQFVVDGLRQFATQGASMSATEVNALVSRINNTRCKNVLPAIDAYFRAASSLLDNGLTALANRPNNCPA